MNYYELIRLPSFEEADDYGKRLGCKYKVVPTTWDDKTVFAVCAHREYTGGRLSDD